MKLKITQYTASRRQAKKMAMASEKNGFFAYPLGKQHFGIISSRDGVVQVLRMSGRRAPYPYHWSQLENGYLQ